MKKTANNTLILTVTNFINRAIGFVFRIALIRIAGREAIGLWQMIMPLYFFFLVIASAGLPTAISRLTAEYRARGDRRGVQRVFKTALSLALVCGIAAALCLLLLAGFFSRQVLADPRVRLALIIIAPSLPLVATSSVFRGYFQGIEEMRVVATSLIVEEVTHVVATITLVKVTLGKGAGLLAAGFAAGSLVSEVAGLGVYLVAFPLFRLAGRPDNILFSTKMLRQILQLSIPATAGRLLHSVGQLCQSIIIPTRLRIAGWTASQAAIAYGELTGMALNLLFLPSLFTVAMATSLLPQITAAVAHNRYRSAQAIFLRALTWTALISLPVAALLISLGEPVCQVLFNSSSAGKLLSYLAWGGLLLYTQQVAAATLQGLGKPVLPLITSAIGTIISSSLLLVLTSTWQIRGVAFSLICGWMTTGALSLYLVQRSLPFFAQFVPRLLRITLAAALCGIAAHHIYLHCLANSGRVFISLLCAGLGSGLVYLIAAGGIIRQQFARR
ncbi:MAG: polysaccharide biosynthesis protein [Firmicutes bacterium]|nr:polysaccharide biosynthesis protein [Bacillota bacterium]